MKGMKFVIVLSFILMVITQCIPTLMAEEPLTIDDLDPYTVSMVCAAAAILAEDEQTASWFTTIVSDAERINHFVTLFALGIKAEEITVDEVADVVEACIEIIAGVEARE